MTGKVRIQSEIKWSSSARSTELDQLIQETDTNFFPFTKPRAVAETDTHFSDVCQVVATFMHGLTKLQIFREF